MSDLLPKSSDLQASTLLPLISTQGPWFEEWGRVWVPGDAAPQWGLSRLLLISPQSAGGLAGLLALRESNLCRGPSSRVGRL